MRESTKQILSIIPLLLIIFLISPTRSLCDIGCLKCIGNNICGICDSNNLYVLLNGKCLKQDLEFCLITFNLRSCTMCYPGFYLELSGKCVRNPEGINSIQNCKEYYSYTRCKTCNSKFFIADEGKSCQRIESNFIDNCEIYESESKCSICSDSILSWDQTRCNEIKYEDNNCMLYSDGYECVECNDGYYIEKNEYLNKIEDFFSNLLTSYNKYRRFKHSVTNMPVCKAKTDIKYCKNPLGYHKCAECIDGYHINQNFNECIPNPEPTVFFRSDNITNCFLHNKTMIKRNNIDYLNVECILCYENFYKTINNRKCVQHSTIVNNCKVMSQSIENLCILCESGYYRKDVGDEQCIQREDIANHNCQKYHTLSEICEICEPEFPIKHYNDKICSSKIDKCKTYETSGMILACKQCDFGYYFNATSGTCVSNDTFDPYCAFYDQNKQCLECSFGFYYDTTNNPHICQPNTPEYVEIARCTKFDSIKKDLCIGCKSTSKTIKVENTCKGYDFTKKYFTTATTDLPYCEQTEINDSGIVTCVKPLDEVIDNDENNKKVFVLVTNESKAFDYTSKKIQYCNKHDQIYKSKNDPLTCSECYKSRSVERTFVYDDVSNLDYCLEEEQDSGYCVKFLSSINSCRTYTFTNINTSKCNDQYQTITTPTGNIVIETTVRCPSGCSKSNSNCTVNNCNISLYDSLYTCSSIDENQNCNIYHFFQVGMGVTFNEFVENEIVISPDKKSCLPYYEPVYNANNGCVQSSSDNSYCLLCKKGFYSIPTRNFTYQQDTVESYISKSNSEGFISGCIRFNKVTGACERCTNGKYIFRDSCISCNDLNFAKDSTNLNCIQYVDSQFPNTCEQVSINNSVTYCIKCKNGYVSKIDWDPTFVLNSKFYPYIEGEQSFIQLSTKSLKLLSCDDTNKLFYYKKEFETTLNNCLFYSTFNDVDYCLGCKFGFTGEVYRTPNNFLTVQGCQEDTTCDMSNTYPINKPYISNLITCHECVDKSLIPTFMFFYTTAKGGSSADFIYEPTDVAKKTMNCESPVIPNCLVQFKTDDETMKSYWGGRTHVCAYCKPMYSPLYLTTNSDAFPYEFATSCNYITNCNKSYTPNICEQCKNKKNLVFNSDGTTTCETNSYILSDNKCKTTSSTSSEGICDECKDGYVYLNFKCVALNITSCKRFWKDTCADSTKELGEFKSIIWREYNSDYVINTINCVEVPTVIPNCEFYIDENTCHQCETGYTLGNNKTQCYQQNINFCIEYNDIKMNCSKCESGYSVTAGVCALSTNLNLRGCSHYSDGFCSQCQTEGFYPVKINANQTSICLNGTISRFCEQIDETKLLNEKIITCTLCKKINDFENLPTESDFIITNYDFIVPGISDYAVLENIKKDSELYSLYLPLQNEIQSIYSAHNLRFSLFKYDFEICQEYEPIANCLYYNDSSFENSFTCIQCTNAYYLNQQTNACEPRDIKQFCIEYYINKNDCKTYIGDNEYSIELSSFDEYVILNNPPQLTPSENTNSGIEGCVHFYDLQTCSSCNSTTYLYDNLCLAIQTLVAECEIYERDGLCQKCKEGLLLYQNKCLPIYSKNCLSYLSNTDCYHCPKEYPLLSNGSCVKNPLFPQCERFSNLERCQYCEDDYFIDQEYNCEFYPDYIENCKKHREGPYCLECNENYVLQNNFCIYKPYFDKSCKKYEAVSKCNVCRFNYYFKERQCYPCTTDPFKCFFCDPNNPHLCIVCRSGFFMNNNFECIRVPDFTQALVRLHQENISSKYEHIIFSYLVYWIMLVLTFF